MVQLGKIAGSILFANYLGVWFGIPEMSKK